MGLVRDLAAKRRTHRRFSSDTPPVDAIKRALDAAREAPSGSNRQPWRFMLISSNEGRKAIREAAEEGEKGFYESLSEERKKWYTERGLSWRKPVFEEAPLLLVVAGDTTAPNYVRGIWLMIGWLLLALEEEGLATFTYTPSAPEVLKKALKIPDPWVVESVLPIGYSKDTKPKEPRKPLSELMLEGVTP